MSYSVGLHAVNAYNNISNTTAVSNVAQTSNLKNANGAAKFQGMVNANFNQFATMTQAEILKQVSQANNNISAINNPLNIVKSSQNNASFVTEVVKDISEKVRKQEELSLKRVVGEASVTDVAMASVQANNAFRLATELRNKMQDFIDKTMNINI